MTYRIIYAAASPAPGGQQAFPMPGTAEYAGEFVGDMLANEIPAGLPGVLGVYKWDGDGLTVVTPLDMAAYMDFVPDIIEYEEDGETPSGSHPAPQKLTHNWAGWPEPTT